MKCLKTLKIAVGILFLTFLFGCSIHTDYYIQNLTDTAKIIKIHYKRSISDELKWNNSNTFSFNYENQIVEPKYFKKNKVLKYLSKEIINDSLITFVIPAHSTVRIDKTMNYNWISRIGNIEIDGKNYSLKELDESQYMTISHLYNIYKIR